eukprot:810807-Prymnesium_polylepis.2
MATAWDAVKAGDVDAIKQFDKATAESTDGSGLTPLHHAAKHKDHAKAGEMIEALLALEADANRANPKGETPLHVAVAFRNYNAIVPLVTAGADVLVQLHKNKYTPLHSAVMLSDSAQVLDALLQSDQASDALKVRDSNGLTPLALARERNKSLACAKLEQFVPVTSPHVKKQKTGPGPVPPPTPPKPPGKPLEPVAGTLKAVALDFDDTITVGALGDDPYVLPDPSAEELMKLFGGKERVDELRELFRALRRHGVHLYIVSLGVTAKLRSWLQRIELFDTINGIFGHAELHDRPKIDVPAQDLNFV